MSTWRIMVRPLDTERRVHAFEAKAERRRFWGLVWDAEHWGWGNTEQEAVGEVIARITRPERQYPHREVTRITLMGSGR